MEKKEMLLKASISWTCNDCGEHNVVLEGELLTCKKCGSPISIRYC